MNKKDKARLDEMYSKHHKQTKIERNKEQNLVMIDQVRKNRELIEWLATKIPEKGYLFIDSNSEKIGA